MWLCSASTFHRRNWSAQADAAALSWGSTFSNWAAVAFLCAFILALPWMLHKMTAYTVLILGDLSRYAR